MLRELHERIYGSQVAKTSVALKALRNGYLCIIMKADTFDLVKKCDKYQRHVYVLRKPFPEQLPLVVVWPFDQ